MFDRPPPPPAELTDPAEAVRARALAGLDSLAERAVSLAEEYQRKAMATLDYAQTPEDAAMATSYGMAFNRTARSARQLYALQMRLAEKKVSFLETTRQARRAWEGELAGWEDRRTAAIHDRRATVRTAVEAAIDAERRPEREHDRLFADLDDRLDETLPDRFLARSIPQMVAEICEALGVAVDVSLWRDEAWEAEEIAEFAPPPGPEPAPMAASP